ncbi:hypothetical protein SAMN04244567_01642 [Paracoccus pantotrophus]|nr:hypothetical protein SAMN04244567_01642 [Paracoccus pantotrophus]
MPAFKASWTSRRRIVVQRWPAVPVAPKAMAHNAMSRSAEGRRCRHCCRPVPGSNGQSVRRPWARRHAPCCPWFPSPCGRADGPAGPSPGGAVQAVHPRLWPRDILGMATAATGPKRGSSVSATGLGAGDGVRHAEPGPGATAGDPSVAGSGSLPRSKPGCMPNRPQPNAAGFSQLKICQGRARPADKPSLPPCRTRQHSDPVPAGRRTNPCALRTARDSRRPRSAGSP